MLERERSVQMYHQKPRKSFSTVRNLPDSMDAWRQYVVCTSATVFPTLPR